MANIKAGHLYHFHNQINPQTEGKLWAAKNSKLSTSSTVETPKSVKSNTALVIEKQKCAMLIQKSCPSHMACNESNKWSSLGRA